MLGGDWGPSSPPPKKGRGTAAAHFSAHVNCGQTAGWIKILLGTEVGLSPGHIVLDGDPAPPPKRGAVPLNFRSMSVVAKELDGATMFRGHCSVQSVKV